MMKKAFLAALLLLWTMPAEAQTAGGMTEEDLIRDALADGSLQENIMDRISMYDVNGDGAVSATEISELVAGVSEQDAAVFQSMEIGTSKEDFIKMIKDAFAQADANGDQMLRGDEIKGFAQSWEVFILKQKFKQMDRNGDGVLTEEDMPTMEESMKKLEEATQKMQELAEKLEQIDPEEAAQNMFLSFGTAAAKEDFIQMDKDKDGCVTRDEYADYHVAQQEAANDSEAGSYVLSREDYLGLFTREDKKNPKCLTMEEYVANEAKSIEDISSNFMEDDESTPKALSGIHLQLATEDYTNMDKDQNNCVTQDEYVEYNMKVQEEMSDTQKGYVIPRKDFENMYNSITKENPQCLTKDEYFADRAKIYSRLDADKDDDRRVAELMFAEMDEDEDGKLTREEYIKYEMSVHSPKDADKDTFSGIFDVYKGSEKGWLSKEEFVQGYIED